LLPRKGGSQPQASDLYFTSPKKMKYLANYGLRLQQKKDGINGNYVNNAKTRYFISSFGL